MCGIIKPAAVWRLWHSLTLQRFKLCAKNCGKIYRKFSKRDTNNRLRPAPFSNTRSSICRGTCFPRDYAAPRRVPGTHSLGRGTASSPREWPLSTTVQPSSGTAGPVEMEGEKNKKFTVNSSTVFDLISEHALISEHPLFFFFFL